MAKYAATSNGYDVRIPEKTGDNIHVWVASDLQSFINPRNITLTLNVFSRDLQLVTQKRFHLQQVNTYSIDFLYSDSCYYANILSMSGATYRTVFRIDYNGSFTNVTDSPLVFMRPPFKQIARNYAIVQGHQNLFAVVAENSIMADSTELTKVSFLGRENLITENGFQRVRIKRTDLKGHEEIEKIYGSSNLGFSNPYIIFHDTTIIACAFANPLPRKGRSNPYYGSYMFLNKFDTSLRETAESPALIQIVNPARGDDYYQPLGIYPLDKKIIIASVGRSNYESVRYYAPVYGSGSRTIGPYLPPVTNFNLVNSLRITVVGKGNELLKDTIIGSGEKSAQMEWGTRFITASANKIDFFCSIHYRGSRYGIVRTSIDSDGSMQENNIIVDDHYNYRLGAAIKLNTGELIIPYEKNGRTKGIMKLSYDRND